MARKVQRAEMEKTEHGLVPKNDGWFIVNAADAQGGKNETFGRYVAFEGEQRFSQYGLNIHVLEPNQAACHYHGEGDQEDFLVLSGECKVIIEGEEIALKQWDFVHCPPWTQHLFCGWRNKTMCNFNDRRTSK